MRRKAPKLPLADDLQKIVIAAVENFNGDTNELENAIGMLYLGHIFGWKVVYITHSIATVRKYEGILGIVAKDSFPEETSISDHVRGFRVSRTVSNFWKAVKGEHVHEGFRDRGVDLG